MIGDRLRALLGPRKRPSEPTPEEIRAELAAIGRDVRATIDDPGTLAAVGEITKSVSTPQELAAELVDLLEPDQFDALMRRFQARDRT